MFTGIVEETADVHDFETRDGIATITVSRPKGWELCSGQSIACSGVCLTVTTFDEESFQADLTPETLSKTTFGEPEPPKQLNLERAMKPEGMFEGHIVQGHVDRTTTVRDVRQEGKSRVFEFNLRAEDANMVAPKGSVTINGVSLTVVDTEKDFFSVSLIPHTLEITTLSELAKGDAVNLEYDIFAKYVSRAIENLQQP